ncbi:MAG: hypothetical protein Q4D42_04765 [Eubacteriales bacterium]|nr:hypothetical protein [Eubacteriales bacterium]
MKKYRKAVLCALFVCLVLFGYAFSKVWEQSDPERTTAFAHSKRVSPYLSITETVYLDEAQTEMQSICLIYDFEKEKLIQKGTVPYTSGYPLTTYSEAQNCVWYSALSDCGDQLYQNKGGETVQVTDQLCALNHIVQCGDKLFLAAKYLDHYCIEPNFFDMKRGELKQIFPDENDDRFTWAVTCDPQADCLYFSYYSDNLQRGNLQAYNEQHHTEQAEIPDCAPSTICSIDVDTEEITPVYQTEDYVWGLAVSGQQLYYCGSKSGVSPKEEHTCYLVDLKTQEKTECDFPVLISGDMAWWDHVLYCMGWKDEVRGIYAIDLISGDVTLVYRASEQGFINGLSLNY